MRGARARATTARREHRVRRASFAPGRLRRALRRLGVARRRTRPCRDRLARRPDRRDDVAFVEDLGFELEDVEGAVLIMQGGEDRVVPARAADRTAPRLSARPRSCRWTATNAVILGTGGSLRSPWIGFRPRTSTSTCHRTDPQRCARTACACSTTRTRSGSAPRARGDPAGRAARAGRAATWWSARCGPASAAAPRRWCSAAACRRASTPRCARRSRRATSRGRSSTATSTSAPSSRGRRSCAGARSSACTRTRPPTWCRPAR